ncbi:MAG: mitochondrial fission ELM1 family protein [Rhodoblastus sp.]|nr:mitochondrial fission ELM1 family protein [Rhodoblastus sp.]
MLAGASCWVLTDGKAGDVAPCLGLAQALGLVVETRVVRPRGLFALLAPRGPIDPAERPNEPGSPIAPPYPQALIASGRRAVPYLRHVRRASGGKTFTIFLKDPRVDPRVADVVWVAEHDRMRGENVIATLAAPHLVTHVALSAARENPDPRIAALPEPRMALLIGGASRHYDFLEKDAISLIGVVESMILTGGSAMITPSRRTPRELLARLRGVCADAPKHTFLWDGTGDNPYIQMLAHASTIVVTADSTNMVGEAIATDAPVMIYEPTGGNARLARFIRAVVASGRARRWHGRLESWPCLAHDDTPTIADEIARRYALFRAER